MKKLLILTAITFYSSASPALAECDLMWREFFWKRASVADVQEQLDAGADINGRCGRNDEGEATIRTPLHKAVVFAELDVVEFLIDNWADVDALDHIDETPLSVAVRRKRPEIVAAVISGGANVDLGDPRFGNVPILLAVMTDNSPEARQIVQLLLDAGVRVNVENYQEKSTLIFATQFDPDFEMVRALLSAGANPNKEDVGGRTALHYAAMQCSSSVVQVLLQFGASKDIRDNDGERPAQVIGNDLYGGTRLCENTDHNAVSDLLR